ncbi:MAG: DUF5302 domain-containing protein [Actinomycetota bacterium]
MTSEKDKSGSDRTDQDDKPVQPVAGSAEDVKRKFREALDKKHAHGGRAVSEDGDQAKIHDAHGPAKAQQMFRRKSG